MQYENDATRRPVVAAAASSAALAQPSTSRAKGPWSGSTWTSRRSTMPTTSRSMRPIATRSASAASPTARRCAPSSARPSASPTVRPRSRRADIYRTKQANAPVNIFIHGGAWRANRAADYAFLAEPFVNAGAHFVVLDFINVDDAGGSLFPMVEQVRRAVGLRLPQRQDVRRRSRPALSVLAFVGLASRRLRGDARLAQGGPAGRHPQGRGAGQRHVRPQAGAALQALEIRQVHRRDGSRR